MDSGKHSLGQRSGVRGQGIAEVAGKCGDWDSVYRTRKSLGERLLRELQRKAAGRVLEWRDLLLAEGGTDRDREVAGGVQHQATALSARLPAACPGGRQPVPATGQSFTAPGCDVDSLIRSGTKTRSGHFIASSPHKYVAASAHTYDPVPTPHRAPAGCTNRGFRHSNCRFRSPQSANCCSLLALLSLRVKRMFSMSHRNEIIFLRADAENL